MLGFAFGIVLGYCIGIIDREFIKKAQKEDLKGHITCNYRCAYDENKFTCCYNCNLKLSCPAACRHDPAKCGEGSNNANRPVKI